jgi:hypothetical protein
VRAAHVGIATCEWRMTHPFSRSLIGGGELGDTGPRDHRFW